MKYYEWNQEKNEALKALREVGFEQIVEIIGTGKDLLDEIPHPNKRKYPGQRMYVVNIGGYAYLVPFVETSEKVFLKTIIPSRKATKKYIIKP